MPNGPCVLASGEAGDAFKSKAQRCERRSKPPKHLISSKRSWTRTPQKTPRKAPAKRDGSCAALELRGVQGWAIRLGYDTCLLKDGYNSY